MAKKIQPICGELTNEQDNIDNNISCTENTTISNSVKSDFNLTNDSELYKQIEDVNKQLLNENSELKDKIANYLIQINELKEKQQLNEINKYDVNELAQLKVDYKTLKDASNGYLMKISELTFENAKLNAEIKELSNSMQINNNFQQKIDNCIQHKSHEYNPYISNGYNSWN